MPSTLPEELVGKYLAAQYQVWIDTTSVVTLQIGCQSAPLAALLQATGNRSAVYVTACNPASEVATSQENRSAMARLYERLACYSNHIYRGTGIDLSGEWPAEESLLALGIDLPLAKRIGSEFGQNAIVWIDDSAAIPCLILLR
ncbi:MAG: DUF3293 domain-containing protein [Nitrosomonas sp.]|nr:DUF3293 domain-containing protein [Nitrosomonas sp.]MDL1865096.1 DUF3293 domain-containing protein [Betaproteobacteria bacterium PRO5]